MCVYIYICMYIYTHTDIWASLVAQLVKNLPQRGRPGFDPWVGKIPWRRERLPTPIFWPAEFHGLYSSWGQKKESHTTEQLPYMYTCIYTFFFLFFSIMAYHRVLNIAPVLYSRTLSFVHSVHSSLHLLTPTSHTQPSPLLHLGNQNSAFCISESVSVL